MKKSLFIIVLLLLSSLMATASNHGDIKIEGLLCDSKTKNSFDDSMNFLWLENNKLVFIKTNLYLYLQGAILNPAQTLTYVELDSYTVNALREKKYSLLDSKRKYETDDLLNIANVRIIPIKKGEKESVQVLYDKNVGMRQIGNKTNCAYTTFNSYQSLLDSVFFFEKEKRKIVNQASLDMSLESLNRLNSDQYYKVEDQFTCASDQLILDELSKKTKARVTLNFFNNKRGVLRFFYSDNDDTGGSLRLSNLTYDLNNGIFSVKGNIEIVLNYGFIKNTPEEIVLTPFVYSNKILKIQFDNISSTNKFIISNKIPILENTLSSKVKYLFSPTIPFSCIRGLDFERLNLKHK